MTGENLSDKARAVMDPLWGNRGERVLMPAERPAPEFFDLASASCFGAISQAELIEVLMQTSQYAGIPAAVAALNAAAEVPVPA